MWSQNDDGSWTADQQGDTLWGLEQITGQDWRDIDYKGKPEDLKLGQTVRYKSLTDKLSQFSSIVGDISGTTAGVYQNYGKAWYTTYTETPGKFVYPIRTLPDLDLINISDKFYSVNKACLYLSLFIGVADGIYTGITTQSFAHGLYRTLSSVISTGLGFAVGGLVTGALTVGTFGAGSIPGVIAGTALGTGLSVGVSILFDLGEKAIWK